MNDLPAFEDTSNNGVNLTQNNLFFIPNISSISGVTSQQFIRFPVQNERDVIQPVILGPVSNSFNIVADTSTVNVLPATVPLSINSTQQSSENQLVTVTNAMPHYPQQIDTTVVPGTVVDYNKLISEKVAEVMRNASQNDISNQNAIGMPGYVSADQHVKDNMTSSLPAVDISQQASTSNAQLPSGTVDEEDIPKECLQDVLEKFIMSREEEAISSVSVDTAESNAESMNNPAAIESQPMKTTLIDNVTNVSKRISPVPFVSEPDPTLEEYANKRLRTDNADDSGTSKKETDKPASDTTTSSGIITPADNEMQISLILMPEQKDPKKRSGPNSSKVDARLNNKYPCHNLRSRAVKEGLTNLLIKPIVVAHDLKTSAFRVTWRVEENLVETAWSLIMDYRKKCDITIGGVPSVCFFVSSITGIFSKPTRKQQMPKAIYPAISYWIVAKSGCTIDKREILECLEMTSGGAEVKRIEGRFGGVAQSVIEEKSAGLFITVKDYPPFGYVWNRLSEVTDLKDQGITKIVVKENPDLPGLLASLMNAVPQLHIIGLPLALEVVRA